MDTELVAAFLAATVGKYASDEEIGELLDPPASASAVGMWRRKLQAHGTVGLKKSMRLAIERYLMAKPDLDGFREGVLSAIAELQAKLDEMRERLR